ncbi:protein BREAST CANCER SUSCEPTIBILITY 2 homolog B-like isoform X1 [Silene latifolia]|uniref:protein BREAST CANCER SUSCEPTIBILITY 2 homolog B-like isoform X1 n=1 Tax=Silene latifolia TaxID=37657 RepID=UPI003D76C7ED
MSTWQLFSDDDNNFRWKISPETTHSSQHVHLPSSPPAPLPSCHDVLLLGCSKIFEDNDESSKSDDNNHFGNGDAGGRLPMFSTGLGNSVVLDKASIAKAASILGDDFKDNVNAGHEFISPNSVFQMGSGKKAGGQGFVSPNSMFQTGSGKKVNISSAGLSRAKALLGMNENDGDEPPKKILRGGDGLRYEMPPNLGKAHMVINHGGTENGTLLKKARLHSKNEIVDQNISNLIQPGMCNPSVKSSGFKFQTAGGRSISVSGDALQRAKNLLGDQEIGSLLDEEDAGASMFSFCKNGNSDGGLFNKENNIGHFTLHQLEKSEQNPKIFVSPMKQSSDRKQTKAKSEALVSGTNLISKFNAEASLCISSGKQPCPKEPFMENHFGSEVTSQHTMANGVGSGLHRSLKQSGRPLADITNTIDTNSTSVKGTPSEVRRLGRRTSLTPFKMPRSSKFVTPLNNNLHVIPNGYSSRMSETSFPRRKVSMRYPPQSSRTYITEFFKEPPAYPQKLEIISSELRQINPECSEEYTFLDGSRTIDAGTFYDMLLQSGASAQHITKKWVANHYKWIVWKLACYERLYSAKFAKKFLTSSNVLEELKYRYEREVNHGQRSAIKRILEGDASPTSMLVLCISAIRSASEGTSSTKLTGETSMARLELTDGWYSIDALLDPLLSKHLAVGKLFVGQKLRICGAGLNAWEGPVSPLEASATVSLVLHINGTYRASWDARLGLCRGAYAPLAFRCIKGNGGSVPRTLVGVTRIYPVLYRERLKNGGYIVRSEKMETAVSQLYSQRRSNIIEGLTLDFQRGSNNSFVADDYDNEEGAKILKMLEHAAEPELMMAEMSSEQLTSFSIYRAKAEENRQCDLQKLIEKAIEDAGLSGREVSPFMRVRVVGLQCKDHAKIKDFREGLITIWNPSERQKLELEEGQTYAISGLLPLHSDSNTLYLQARGSSTKWQPLKTIENKSFMPFFNPRKALSLSRMGEVPLSSEFDTAVFVVHVGLEHVDGLQKKQWVFVTDGSLSELRTDDSTMPLLAISFCSPCTDDDSTSPINYNLVGSIVCFCNLVKRAKDHANHMWVAEATENSTYYLNYEHPSCSHVKDAFGLVKKWEQNSSLTIEKLKKRVLYIIGDNAP